MDRETFDALTRGIGKQCTRRSALAGLAAGVLGLGAAKRVAAEVSVESCGDYGDKCLSNTDCCTGLKCKGGDRTTGQVGRCVDKNAKKCRADQDCKRSERCVRGRCESKDECSRDNDCKLGTICSRGRCVNGCRGNSDCPRNEFCDRGRCIEDCAPSGARCSSGRECCSRSCYRSRCD
jgi:hypothetical protein